MCMYLTLWFGKHFSGETTFPHFLLQNHRLLIGFQFIYYTENQFDIVTCYLLLLFVVKLMKMNKNFTEREVNRINTIWGKVSVKRSQYSNERLFWKRNNESGSLIKIYKKVTQKFIRILTIIRWTTQFILLQGQYCQLLLSLFWCINPKRLP